MAKTKVTGKPEEWFEEEKREHEASDSDEPWAKQYCMARISSQPEGYDGAQRYCSEWRDGNLYEIGDNWLCKFHGGKGGPTPENLDKLANMTHGMNATREHLVEDFDEKDRALYDWIVDSYAEAYDIDVENDPNAAYDLHRYAAEAVRAERGRGYLIEEGEVTEQKRFSEDGSVVIDENGEIVTEKSEHYLTKMLDRQDKKLTQLANALGISRKDRLKRDQTDDAVEAITKGFSELGAAFLNREEREYDPDDQPWDEDNEPESES